jgi:hypothetical protein
VGGDSGGAHRVPGLKAVDGQFATTSFGWGKLNFLHELRLRRFGHIVPRSFIRRVFVEFRNLSNLAPIDRALLMTG